MDNFPSGLKLGERRCEPALLACALGCYWSGYTTLAVFPTEAQDNSQLCRLQEPTQDTISLSPQGTHSLFPSILSFSHPPLFPIQALSSLLCPPHSCSPSLTPNLSLTSPCPREKSSPNKLAKIGL